MPPMKNVKWYMSSGPNECFLKLGSEAPSATDGARDRCVIIDPELHWCLQCSTAGGKSSKNAKRIVRV